MVWVALQIFPKMANFTPNHRATSVGNQLLQNYRKFLASYEDWHQRDITPIQATPSFEVVLHLAVRTVRLKCICLDTINFWGRLQRGQSTGSSILMGAVAGEPGIAYQDTGHPSLTAHDQAQALCIRPQQA